MHVPLNKPKAKDRETGNSTQEQEKRWDLICEYLCVIILNENDKKVGAGEFHHQLTHVNLLSNFVNIM